MSVLEVMARRMFEVWRSKMDRDGEHQHDLHSFEDMSEYERDFAFGHARAALEALKDYPPVFGDISKRKGSFAEMYGTDRQIWAELINRLLNEPPNA
jgi:hypothetical protein